MVQPYNRTHLFMCGSGAYSPVCVYVNRGRRPEVGINEGSTSLEKQTHEGINVLGEHRVGDHCNWHCNSCYRLKFSLRRVIIHRHDLKSGKIK